MLRQKNMGKGKGMYKRFRIFLTNLQGPSLEVREKRNYVETFNESRSSEDP